MVIAITGCSGSGKSTVLNILKQRGCRTFDFDLFSVQLIKKSQTVMKKLGEYIEEVPVDDYGYINLSKINMIFDNDVSAEKEFELWYQQYLGKKMRRQLIKEKLMPGIIFADIPFLDMKKIVDYIDRIWIIEADFKQCFERIEKRNHYANNKIDYLIQRSLVPKDIYNMANVIIKNNTSKESLEDIVINLVSEI